MASKDQGAAEAASDAPPLDPQVAAEAAEVVAEADKPDKGWVRNIQTDTYHEVEDRNVIFAAYPGQYEKISKPGERSNKIGWKQDDAAAE